MSAPSNTTVSESRDSHEERAKVRLGQVLRGKWRLDSLLGVGGMAAVYAATHRNQKRGAVKILHAEVAAQPDAQERFVREGYVANSVDHEGVVSVLDDDVSEDGCAFLVMELLKGDSVSNLAEKWPNDRMPPADVLKIADELLDVLAAAHQKGIVHRDLKPDNLFVTQAGKLKVLDFGIAKLQELTYGGSKTATGTLMGTPCYMPPEQALGEWSRVDARSDIWAVGATMFNLLTGRTVHEADTMQKLLLAAMTRPAPPLGSIDATLPPELCAVVDRALAFQQEGRFPDARSMQAAVRAAQTRLEQMSLRSTAVMQPGAPYGSMHGQQVPAAAAPTAVLPAGAMPLSVPLTRHSGPAPSIPSGPTLASVEAAAKSVNDGSWGGARSASMASHPGTLSPTTPVGHRTMSGGSKSTAIAIAIAAVVGIAGAAGLYLWTRTEPTTSGVDTSSTAAAAASTASPVEAGAAPATTEEPPASAGASAAPSATGEAPSPAASSSATASAAPSASSPSPVKTGAGSTARPPSTGTGSKKPPGTDDKYGL